MKQVIKTRTLLDQLEHEGFDCKYSNIQSYIRERQVKPEKRGGRLVWDKHVIKELKTLLIRFDRGPKKGRA